MIAAFASWAAAPVAKLAAIGAVIAALSLGLWIAVRQHDARVVAEARAEQQAATIAQMAAEHARAVSALEARAAQSEQEAEQARAIKAETHAAPRTSDCLHSPAVAAELRWLRDRTSPAAATAARRDPAEPAHMPGRADPAGDAHR